MERYDIITVGGGLVGTAAALALADTGLRVALVEPHPPAEATAHEGWDARVYALSPGNRDWLAQLRAWECVPAERTGCIEAMRVFGDDARSHIDFDSAATAHPVLACTVEHRTLQAALWEAARDRAGLITLAGVSPVSLAVSPAHGDCAELALADGRTLRAGLVLGCDGIQSWVRAAAGLSMSRRPYGQQAIVANFATGEPHRGTAWQWFRRDGVLALLPMPGDRVSVVWSIEDAAAERLLALDAAAFTEAVREAAHDTLGTLTLVTPPRGLPLALVRVPRMVAPRVALAGDAAHGVHPLAGQGVNLGFRDAQALASTLRGREPGRDVGDFLLLRRYERARREDVWATQFVTDGLARLFAADGAFAARFRNAGFAVADRLAPLKRFFTERAAA